MDDNRWIRFRCDECRTALQVGVRMSERQIDCPKCGAPVRVPSATTFNTSDVTAIDAMAVTTVREIPKTPDLPDPSRSSVEYAAERIRDDATPRLTTDPSRADIVAAWPRATLRERWIAALFDSAIIATAGAAAAIAAGARWEMTTAQSVGVFGLTALLAGIANDWIGGRLRGASVGKWLVGIEIRRAVNGEPPTAIDSLIRLAAKWPLGALLFPLIGMDSKARAVHDLISGTRVLRAPKQ